MPVSQLPQAPYRQDRKLFPTPLTTDVLFSEIRDCNRNAFPEYGTPHPNAAKWPYHKLIFIKPVDIERNEIFEFFYAADRENQDLYNFASGFRNIIGNVGGREFRVVLREYVTPRADFDPALPEFGSVMPDVPQDTFDGVDYVFFDKQQKKIEQPELDSLYVQETHTYVETAFLDYKLSYLTQVPDLVPDKYRSSLPRTTTEEIVEGIAVSPTLAANELQASQDQLNPNVKLVKSVIQPKPTTDVVLFGKRNYVESTKANTVETYSSGILTPDSGFLVAQSIVTPTGDGSSIKETVSVDAWPTLVSSEWDDTLNTQIITTEQFVPPSLVDTSLANTSYKAVNEDRTLKTVQTTPSTSLDTYSISFPSRMDIQVPDTLKSIEVIWSQDSGAGYSNSEWLGNAIGTSGSVSGNETDTATATATVKPELKIDIQKSWGSDIPVRVIAFFIQTVNGSVTESSLRQRLTSIIGPNLPWPLFKPVSHTIVLTGAKVGVSVSAGATVAASFSEVNSSYDKSSRVGSDRDGSLSVQALTIPATLHPTISIGGGTTKEQTVSVSVKTGFAQNGFYFAPLNFDVENNGAAVARGSVSPTVLPATSPPAVPTSGLYVIRTSVEPYKWGWAKCTAVVLDASNLA